MNTIFMNAETLRDTKNCDVGCKIVSKHIAKDCIVLINTAIAMRQEEFIGEKHTKLQNIYINLATHVDSFFQLTEMSADGEYAIFGYQISDEWKSLRQLKKEDAAKIANNLFAELINILHKYRNTAALNQNGYTPLLFISADSVYVNTEDENNLKVHLVPMPYDMTANYAGMPKGIDVGNCDESVDIYMAAYLYLKLLMDANISVDGNELCTLAERCLSPFAARRPEIEQLIKAFDGSFSHEEHSKKAQLQPDYEIKFVPDNIYRAKKERKTKAEKMFDKFKKSAKKKVSKVTDRVDDALSTEQGDDADEE